MIFETYEANGRAKEGAKRSHAGRTCIKRQRQVNVSMRASLRSCHLARPFRIQKAVPTLLP